MPTSSNVLDAECHRDGLRVAMQERVCERREAIFAIGNDWGFGRAAS
jgi:hypothetical protein